MADQPNYTARFAPTSNSPPDGLFEATANFESLSQIVMGWLFQEFGKQKSRTESEGLTAQFSSEPDLLTSPQTILICEDEPTLLAMIREMVAAFGYRPIAVANASAALRALTVNRVDLIISDIHLPGISGIELLKQIKEITPQIPVFLMSGEPGALASAARACQADALIPKPFFIEDFGRLIEQALNPLSIGA